MPPFDDEQSFQGRHGRAFLFNNVVNITLGPKEDRLLMTGLHTVADIYCIHCQVRQPSSSLWLKLSLSLSLSLPAELSLSLSLAVGAGVEVPPSV